MLFMSLADFSNRDVVILGCGSIFMGSIQLLIQEINLTPERITVISNTEAPDLVHTLNLNFQQQHLTTDNILNVLSQYAKSNCLLINLSVNVSSLPVIEYCQKKNILYFDTSYECWKTSPEGIDFDTEFCLASERNNLLEIKPQSQSQQTTTALTEHGANPGMVSHFVKQAVIAIQQ